MLTFLISVLAVWRICSLILEEDGPFEIFKRLRNYFHVYHWDDFSLNEQRGFLLSGYSEGDIITDGDFFGELLTCHWCLSIWISLLISIYLGIVGLADWQFIPLLIPALSACSIFIHNWSEE